jgi:hypothetical protein
LYFLWITIFSLGLYFDEKDKNFAQLAQFYITEKALGSIIEQMAKATKR